MTNQFYTKIQVDEQGRFIGEELRKVKSDLTTYVNNKSVTQEERDKLAGLESSKYLGTFTASSELPTVNAGPGSYADVDVGEGSEVERWVFDPTDGIFVKLGSTIGSDTAATIKSKYESNPNTNAFTDNEKTKLLNLEPFTIANNTDDFLLALEGTTEELPTEEIRLAVDYPGTGWYLATDTGTVFNKGVPEGETHRFTPEGTEYVSVYNMEDAKLHGSRAAISNLQDTSNMFAYDTTFNEDISSWDMSNVTDMYSMFSGASNFNQDISKWNVSKVKNMGYVFKSAVYFNQYIGDWNTRSVTNMAQMFSSASNFNQDISKWNVSKVTNMDYMFYGANKFNQDLSLWCVPSLNSESGAMAVDATPSWTLPKPVWGTCPRGENTEIER